MLCPICSAELQPVDRQGVEVDLCPQCQGVWLARVELDRLMVHPSPFDVDWDRSDRESTSERQTTTSARTSDSRGGRVGQYWSHLFAAK